MTTKIKDKKGLIFNIQKFSLHDGPGIRSVVFFKGCPLQCFWCANPESQDGNPEEMWDGTLERFKNVGDYMSVDEIMEEVLKDKPFYDESGGGVTLSGGEVLYQAEFAIDLLKELKANGIHTNIETCGTGSPAHFREMVDLLDLIYMDFKHPDPIKHQQGTGGRNEVVKQNIKYAINNHPHVLIRVPIIPGFNDSIETVPDFVAAFKEMGVDSIELLPFHQFGESKYENLNREYELAGVPQLHTEDLDEHKRIFEENGIACYVH